MSMSKVNQLRASILDKRAERAAAEASPLSRGELRAALDRQIARASEAERFLARRVGIDHYEDGVLVGRVVGGRVELLPAMIALFGADAVRSNLDRFIAQAPDAPEKGERDARLTTIDDQILKLELAEESALRAMEATGVEVMRRPDASPAVVLANLP
jgi:hypothetical protein